MKRSKELDETIVKYKEMIVASGLNFKPEPLMVYTAIPLLESVMPSTSLVKFINRVTGLTWERIHQELRFLENEKFIEFDKRSYSYKFTHSLDALLMDELFKEIGIIRPLFIPFEKISSRHLIKFAGLKEYHLKEIKHPISLKQEFIKIKVKNKMVKMPNVSFNPEDVVDFLIANSEEFPEWKNIQPNKEGPLYQISFKFIDDGLRRMKESQEFQAKLKKDRIEKNKRLMEESRSI